MSFRIRGLSPDHYSHLLRQPDDVLSRAGAERLIVDSSPGYPDRITLEDLPVGESVLLLNHMHQPADTPYRASHAIFIGERGIAAFDGLNIVPPALEKRLISLRAFDPRHHMVDADVVPGTGLASLIERMLASPEVDYLHAHYAKRGCYAARVERA